MAKKGLQQRRKSATAKGGVQGTVAMSHNDCNFIWMGNWDKKEQATHELNSWMDGTVIWCLSFGFYLNGKRNTQIYVNLNVNDKRFIPVLKLPKTEKDTPLWQQHSKNTPTFEKICSLDFLVRREEPFQLLLSSIFNQEIFNKGHFHLS